MVHGSGIDMPGAMDPRITQVITSMERDLDGSLAIGALAQSVNLSPSRLTVLFKRETGVSPVRYLRAMRMERARLLLERTFLSVKEVMAFVGIHDPSHFTRDFSRHHGIAPSRLRQYSWAPEAWRLRGMGQRPQFANDRSRRGLAPIVDGKGNGDGHADAAPNTSEQPVSRPRGVHREGDR